VNVQKRLVSESHESKSSRQVWTGSS